MPGSHGFQAAVVVTTAHFLAGSRTELFPDERVLDGRFRLDPGVSLDFALQVGEAAIAGQHALQGRAKAQTLPYWSINQPETNP